MQKYPGLSNIPPPRAPRPNHSCNFSSFLSLSPVSLSFSPAFLSSLLSLLFFSFFLTLLYFSGIQWERPSTWLLSLYPRPFLPLGSLFTTSMRWALDFPNLYAFHLSALPPKLTLLEGWKEHPSYPEGADPHQRDGKPESLEVIRQTEYCKIKFYGWK